MDGLPEIQLADQSGQAHGIDLAWLNQLGRRALPKVWDRQRAESVLADVTAIEVTLVDDPIITEVHREFMEVGTPTDVITFHHGEILISIDTAARQAVEYGRSLREEVALYLIHGLLHLAGFEDKEASEFAAMARMQETILTDSLTE